MPKKNPIERLRRYARDLYDRAAERVRRFTKQTDEVLSEEPIDFSAPSIPYYENLANRLSFVRVILYMVLFVFITVTVLCNHRFITYENLYYLAKDIGAATLTAQSRADQISYPISSTEADFVYYRGGMVVAGSEVVTALSGSGRQTMSVNVAYANPCARASDKYFLTFGRGEPSFAVYNSFVQVHREITEYPIYDAAVGDSGNFAVVTRSRDYTSEVILYDSDMNQLGNYHLNGYVTGLSMNREGNRLGVVSAEYNGGLWETKVTLIRMTKGLPNASATVVGAMGLQCGFVSDDQLAVVYTDRLMIWESDASVKNETFFEGTVPTLCAIGDNRVAILFEIRNDLSESLLQVYDKNGRDLYDLRMDATHPISVSGGAEELTFGNNVLLIRTKNKLYRLSGNGDDLTAAEISQDTVTVLSTEDEVLVCTPAYAARLDKKDFKKE